MPAPPLTHHDILALAAPFARSGRRVDLAATDRLARRVSFQPAAAGAGITEVLQLDMADAANANLTRTLTCDGTLLQAQLQTSGASPADLLQRIDAVAPAQHFDTAPGIDIARSYRLESPAAAGRSPLTLTRASARIGTALLLTLDVPPTRRAPASLHLQPATPGDTLLLPDDLLAVLGWSWSRLTPRDGGWSCTLRLSGRGAARSADAAAKLQRSAAHLAQTLAEPPARFHQRHRAARWRMTLRRSVPLLVCLALLAAAIIIPQLALDRESVLRMLVFNAPPLLLGLLFSLREVPRFEIPPLPRPLRAQSWRRT